MKATALAVAALFFASLLAFATHASFDTETSLGATNADGGSGSTLSTAPAADAGASDAVVGDTPTSTVAAGGTAAPTRSAGGTARGVAAASTIPVPALVSKTKLPANGPGITDTEVQIGIETLTNVGAAYAAVGYKGVVPTDQDIKNVSEAIADAVNRRGGIAGRKMVPVLHFTDITAGTADTRGQTACSFFTEDHHVFAVVGQGNHGDAFSSCLSQHHTPFVDDANSWALDDGDLARLAPYVWEPGKLSLSRFAAYIDGLASAAYFAPGSKIGLLRYDSSNQVRARDNVIVPALARHGLKLTDDFAFSVVQSVSDLSISAAQATNAAVRFRGSGIDHIIFLPSAGVITTVFPVAAEDQHYRPRYGLDSAELPNNMTSNSPPGQLDNAILVGWSSLSDRGQTFVNSGNPLWVYCRAVMREHGTLEAGAFGCGPYFFLQEALARATEASALGVRSGADKLGRAPWSTGSYGTNVRPGHYDGAGAILIHHFDAACTCFLPSGSAVEIP